MDTACESDQPLGGLTRSDDGTRGSKQGLRCGRKQSTGAVTTVLTSLFILCHIIGSNGDNLATGSPVDIHELSQYQVEQTHRQRRDATGEGSCEIKYEEKKWRSNKLPTKGADWPEGEFRIVVLENVSIKEKGNFISFTSNCTFDSNIIDCSLKNPILFALRDSGTKCSIYAKRGKFNDTVTLFDPQHRVSQHKLSQLKLHEILLYTFGLLFLLVVGIFGAMRFCFCCKKRKGNKTNKNMNYKSGTTKSNSLL